jgi:hypothetical protein
MVHAKTPSAISKTGNILASFAAICFIVHPKTPLR